MVELPKDMSISPTFNVSDLFEYHPPDLQSNAVTNLETSLFLSSKELMQGQEYAVIMECIEARIQDISSMEMMIL